MNLAAINTNLLVALNALLREQNVSRAAETMGVTQSSMSHALSQLRTHFGDRLLVPSGRRMVLTERGRTLVVTRSAPARLPLAHPTGSTRVEDPSRRAFAGAIGILARVQSTRKPPGLKAYSAKSIANSVSM